MANKNQEEKDTQPAGNTQGYLDHHPRPSRAAEAAPLAAAVAEAAAVDPHKCTPTTITKTGSNGDEEHLKGPDGKPNYIGNFHKGLPHDGFGEVDRNAYQSLLHALNKKKDFDKIILGLGRKLTNPQSGLATDPEGPDPKKLHILAAPSLDSAEEAAEGVELYWMALLRDVPFLRFDSEPLAAAAVVELNRLADFRGRIGSRSGELIPEYDQQGKVTGYVKDPDGKYVTSRLAEDMLSQLASKTGGEYLRADAKRFGVEAMEAALSGLKRTENEARLVKQYDEVYEFLVLPAFLLLVGEACVNERRRRAAV